MTAEDLRQARTFARYKDVDGDGVGWRTLPGTDHPQAAYFARGTGHNEAAVYSERSDDWEENMERLHRKFETARKLVPGPVIDTVPDTPVGLIGFGSADPPIVEARYRLHKAGLEASYLRVRALPLSPEVRRFIEDHERTYVLELNTDGQWLN